MSHEKRNHDEDDGHDDHDEFRFTIPLPSPLPDDVERVMTRVIDCAMQVHRQLGPGFLESIYQRAMSIELSHAGLPYEEEKRIDVVYKGIAIPGQRVDLVVAGKVVVELKAVQRFEDVHRAQVISYLRTLRLRAGLLINFRVPLLHQGIKRIVV
jgi:GxxExxY protein